MKKPFLILLMMIFTCDTAFADAASDAALQQAANSAASANSAGKAAASLAAAMLAATATMEASKCSTNPSMCALAALHAAMAMMAAAQASENGSVQNQATTTSADSSAGSTTTTSSEDPTITRADAGDGTMRAIDDNMTKLIAGIDGAKVNSDGTVSYNGNNLSSTDSSSGASMAASGFSADQIALAKMVNDKLGDAINSKLGALTAANGYQEGSGISVAGAQASVDKTVLKLQKKNPSITIRLPANVAGLQKNFNGEPIGVAGDNIFVMVNRRYKAQDEHSAFFNQ